MEQFLWNESFVVVIRQIGTPQSRFLADSGRVHTSVTQSGNRAPFEQAGIRVEKLEAFEQLRSAFARVFASREVESFLKLLQRKGVPIRDFDRVLSEHLLEQLDARLGTAAKQLYESLSLSDRAQIREFYLTALEDVDDSLRARYSKVYRYY